MNRCRYCDAPAKRILCGSVECARRYNADRAREAKRIRTGFYERPTATACARCGSEFPTVGKQRFCSKRCADARPSPKPMSAKRIAARRVAAKAARGTHSSWVWISGTCDECGDAFARHGVASPYCSKRCSNARRRRERRAREAGMKITPVRRFRIHERDDWTCHICGDPVNRTAVVPELDAPTLDHVIALAAGGAHDESNLKTAHFYCNSVKRELPLSQVA